MGCRLKVVFEAAPAADGSGTNTGAAMRFSKGCRTPPVRGPSASTTWRSDGPSMNSLTRYGVSPSTSASRMRAVQNGATRLALASSPANLARALASPVNCACSSLTATFSPS
jgi:hypothetical protein